MPDRAVRPGSAPRNGPGAVVPAAGVSAARPGGALPGSDGRPRCPWAVGTVDYERYHDEEWGQPLRGDDALFERISLEAFQSGLSWLTILRKRDNFRVAFAGFDPAVVAGYDDRDVERLLTDRGIVRNRAKIAATIANAQAVLALGPGGLTAIVWSYRPAAVSPAPQSVCHIPASTPESTSLARALRGVGFRFVGPTTAYALMQAAGIVNDHLSGCIARARDASPR